MAVQIEIIILGLDSIPGRNKKTSANDETNMEYFPILPLAHPTVRQFNNSPIKHFNDSTVRQHNGHTTRFSIYEEFKIAKAPMYFSRNLIRSPTL